MDDTRLHLEHKLKQLGANIRVIDLDDREGDERVVKVELLEELFEIVELQTHRWDYCPSSSDWECVYCNERPPTHNADITHRDDCDGKRLLKQLNFLIHERTNEHSETLR